MDRTVILYTACFRPKNYSGDYFSINMFCGLTSNLNSLFDVMPPADEEGRNSYIIEIRYGEGKPAIKPLAKWNGSEWIKK